MTTLAGNTGLGTEAVGGRVYVIGNSFPVKDRLKAAGCHWDPDRRQWWIGAAKASALATIVASAASAPAAPEDLGKSRVYGKVQYKGRSYYVLAQGSGRVRLTVLDGSIVFWADESACQWEKRYSPREERGAYGRPTGRQVYQTLGGIRSFVQREREARAAGEPVCAECGRSGELVRDLEDGMMKHRHCCDMAP